jgi:hypothetical protein
MDPFVDQIWGQSGEGPGHKGRHSKAAGHCACFVEIHTAVSATASCAYHIFTAAYVPIYTSAQSFHGVYLLIYISLKLTVLEGCPINLSAGLRGC